MPHLLRICGVEKNNSLRPLRFGRGDRILFVVNDNAYAALFELDDYLCAVELQQSFMPFDHNVPLARRNIILVISTVAKAEWRNLILLF